MWRTEMSPLRVTKPSWMSCPGLQLQERFQAKPTGHPAERSQHTESRERRIQFFKPLSLSGVLHSNK